MAEPRVVGRDERGPDAPAVAEIDLTTNDLTTNDLTTNDLTTNDNGNGNGNGNGVSQHGAVIRVLHPEATASPGATLAPPVPSPANPIAWLAPAEPSFVVLRDDLRDDLYDDLRDDLADDLRDDLRQELRGDLRADLRADLRTELLADLDADLDELREELYEEVDDLRDDVFPEDSEPATALPRTYVTTETALQGARARRVAFVAASVLALGLIAAIVLVWQRADTARIVAARPTPAVVAPPDLDGVVARVQQLDQQLAGLLAVSTSPSAPSDVSLQIAALREELSSVQGCLLAVRRAVGAGADTASAIEYC